MIKTISILIASLAIISGLTFFLLLNKVPKTEKAPIYTPPVQISEPSESELTQCTLDSDCVLVPADCCGCSMGGSDRPINKKYQEEFTKKHDANCKDTMCLAVYNCTPGKTTCDNSVCTFHALQKNTVGQ